jgi:hypothetical protein
MSPRTLHTINPFLKLVTLYRAFVVGPDRVLRDQDAPSENAELIQSDETIRHLKQTYSLERRTFF